MHPLLGPRFRANELHDFDLCSSCHTKTTPTDVTSKPVLTFVRIEGSAVPDGACGRGWGWGGRQRGRHGKGGGPRGQHGRHGPNFHARSNCAPPPCSPSFSRQPAQATVEQLVEEAIKRSIQVRALSRS